MPFVIEASYFLAAFLFITGLRRMSSPRTARSGILWAGAGMVLATGVTFAYPDLHNYVWILVALAVGSVLAWVSGKRVAMTAMPQMVALYNGMGGGAAAAIATVELTKHVKGDSLDPVTLVLAVLGGLIGAVAFSGSLIAFAKLQGWIRKTIRFGSQHWVNLGFLVVTLALGALVAGNIVNPWLLIGFLALALVFGVLMTIPIGGADMPVVISLYNAFTGLAVAFEGFVLGNAAMIIAGIVVGAAGTLLTQEMARAMNRSLMNVLVGSFGAKSEGEAVQEAGGTMKALDANDAAIMMAYSKKVIVVPGYGMAVAQAQHKLWELVQLLSSRGVAVKFAIHPVAGRMPGHMNVLLAEAGVPYDMIFDLEEVNNEFPTADVSLVIGANDVVNPVARSNPESPIYGMPILDVDKSNNVLVVKRGRGAGFSGVENQLFFADNTRMLFGDAQQMMVDLIAGVKSV